MKGFGAQLAIWAKDRPGKHNRVLLWRFMFVLMVMIVAYSVTFHYLMAMEDQDHSWTTGFYWTLTVMSTLGFGDITFEGDVGRAFSLLVLLSGVLFLLVLLPFTVIRFFYQPWVEAQVAGRAPTELDPNTRGHIVLTQHDPVASSVIARCQRFGFDYVLIVPDREEALRLNDSGLHVMVGSLGDVETYRRCRLTNAALLATTCDDATNTKITFVAREVSTHVPIVASVGRLRSAEVLKLAGATHAVVLADLTGEAMARRCIGGDARSHVIDAIGDLQIAEANAARTPLVGKTIAENNISAEFGVVVLGLWERGEFTVAQPGTMIGERSVLLLGGTRQQLEFYDEGFAIYNVTGDPVILVGGGRVGRAAAQALTERGVDWIMVESDPTRRPPDINEDRFIVGDAADGETLKRAGIDTTPAVLLTPHDDSANIYLTILLRDLRPDLQIVSRATHESNVRTLHRAGADSVMSTASLGASRVMNLLRQDSVVPVAEGLSIVRVPIPDALTGLVLAETSVRQDTGATIIATVVDGVMTVNPPSDTMLPVEGDILLIGDARTEQKFAEQYGTAR